MSSPSTAETTCAADKLRRPIKVNPDRPLPPPSHEPVRLCLAHVLMPLVRARATPNLGKDHVCKLLSPPVTPTSSRDRLRAPLRKPAPRRASARHCDSGRHLPSSPGDLERRRHRSQTRRRQSTPLAPPVCGLMVVSVGSIS